MTEFKIYGYKITEAVFKGECIELKYASVDPHSSLGHFAKYIGKHKAYTFNHTSTSNLNDRMTFQLDSTHQNPGDIIFKGFLDKLFAIPASLFCYIFIAEILVNCKLLNWI